MAGLRVCMISEHASPLAALGGADSGGQNVYVAQLARHLAALGMEVDVYTRCDAATLAPAVELGPGARVIHVPAGPKHPVAKEQLWPHMAGFGDWMLRHIAAGSYDIIHANFWMSADVARRLADAWGIPFVVTFHALGLVRKLHQGDADGFPPVRPDVERRAIETAACVIAECDQDRDDLVNLYGADPERITVAPCGVDPSELSPRPRFHARKQLGIDQDAKVILQLGRMVPRKGVDTVIEALALLRGNYRLEAHLLVVGGESDEPDPEATPELARLSALAEERGVADLVRFTGRKGRAELANCYSAADVFVTTPWYEPFGITPLEAMICGIPVVGSNVGGIRSTVVHGETGFLVPARDPDALAARLACLLSNPALAESMGKAGRARALERYTWQLVARNIATIFGGVLAREGARMAAERGEQQLLEAGFRGAVAAIEASRTQLAAPLRQAATLISAAFRRGNKVLVFGNGGSAADAQHFAGELVGRYRLAHRPGLPVIALTCDSAVITAWANDVSYGDVFARQVEALGRSGDVVLGISTSGSSPNVLAAFETARAGGMTTVAFTGKDGGRLAGQSDLALIVPHDDTQHIQEVHSVLVHLLCDLVERRLFSEGATTPEFFSVAGGGV